MILQVPLTPSVPAYHLETVLDDVTFVLDVRWNYRTEQWQVSISDADGAPLATGVALVLGAFLGRRTADARMPAGVLVLSDLSGAGVDAGFDDLGTRVCLYYYSASEFA